MQESQMDNTTHEWQETMTEVLEDLNAEGTAKRESEHEMPNEVMWDSRRTPSHADKYGITFVTRTRESKRDDYGDYGGSGGGETGEASRKVAYDFKPTTTTCHAKRYRQQTPNTDHTGNGVQNRAILQDSGRPRAVEPMDSGRRRKIKKHGGARKHSCRVAREQESMG